MDSTLCTGVSWILALCFLVMFYKWATHYNNYFHKMDIKSMKPSFLIGNCGNLFTKKLTMNEMLIDFYQTFPNEKIMGIFQFRKPLFILRDPQLIKQVAIKDFDNFTDHNLLLGDSMGDLFGNSLICLTGAKWRDMRATLSPIFTGSKMRNMFGLISKCGENMVSTFNVEAKEKGSQVHEMKNLFTRFTTDVIATSAFGIEVNSFKDRDNLVYRLATTIADFNSPKMGLKFLGFFCAPWLMNFFKITLLDGEASTYFTEVIRKNFEAREKDNIVRNDVIQLLMQIKKGQLNHQQDEKPEDAGFATIEESEIGKKVVKREWSEIELIAQCFLFFLAGFDTAATVLSFVAYELALNPDIQQRLFEEMTETNQKLNGVALTYEVLQKMPYLDMVVSEGLRKWPPSIFVERVSTRNCKLEVDDDKTIEIEKGVSFWIPIYAIHHDANYYPDPEKFDPERFSTENKPSIQQYTYLPFGVGPRACIGSRFALMTLKAAFYDILLNFTLEVTAKTEIPLKIAKTAAGFYAENGIHLELRPREVKS